MEYVAIIIFMRHLILRDIHVPEDFAFFRTFETLKSGYSRAVRKAGREIKIFIWYYLRC